tara:strand:- start:57 stop:617 length:561 start_codon:yes stop_codon:yes gene_type:complete
MTRPLGYKDGTRGGTTVGDLEDPTKVIQERILRDVFNKKTGPDGKVDLGQFNSEELKMLFNVSPDIGLFTGLKDFAASEVMKAAGNQKRVDTTQLASDYLRSLQMGLSGNEEALNAMIDILDTQIVPQEELKIIKEGQSDLGKFGVKIGKGIEGLLQFLKLQEEGTGKFQTLDDRTLQKLIEMRAQ